CVLANLRPTNTRLRGSIRLTISTIDGSVLQRHHWVLEGGEVFMRRLRRMNTSPPSLIALIAC
ncbi:MAG: hypothetical protein FWD80_01115, partial [Propionibacteriaceae bacterium]|nr:hypothetical protein [Propionibacteriaceae bacterium]